MKKEELFSYVDHTLLKPTATMDEVVNLCKEALNYKTASVCIPATYIKQVKKVFPELKICTVIGFPLGYSTTKTKVYETKDAIKNGADEIDMVVNISDVKNGLYDNIIREIKAIKKECGTKILKVIIETCYLSQEEKINLCQCVASGGADFIKTSTGFGTAGATVADVKLFKKYLQGTSVRIKAAGGIHTKKEMEALIKAGASRLGCSSAIKALTNQRRA